MSEYFINILCFFYNNKYAQKIFNGGIFLKIRKILFFLCIMSSLLFCGCELKESSALASLSSYKSVHVRQEAIKRSLLEIDGIEEVYVSIWGKTALVGFSVKKDSPLSSEEISKTIEITILNSDNGISYVSVSGSPRIFKRIKNLTGT